MISFASTIVCKHTISFASMAVKYVGLITLLVVVFAATQAEAQLPGLPLNVFNISGNVSCSVNGSVAANGTMQTPPFPNALVQLSCGGLIPRGLAITNRMGAFSFIVNPLIVTLNTLLTSCRVVVATPLSACNATLPSSGTLQAPVQFVNSTVVGPFNITNFAPGEFQLRN